MKKLILFTSILFAYGSVVAQQAQTKHPLNWHLLSYDADSVYGVGVQKAYAELLQGKKSNKIIVAVLDTGIDTLHEDLKNVLWTNKKEIAGNGIDDDKNGYVDDIHGWSFLGSKDGKQNVENGSSEADREYVRILKKYNNDTTKITDPKEKAYLHFLLPKLKVVSLRNHLESMKEIYFGMLKVDSVLRDYYKTDSVSYEQVTQFKTDDPQLMIAAGRLRTEMYNQKGPRSVKAAIEFRKAIYERVKENLNDARNLKVDERVVVGDDPDDINDRFYGNNLLLFKPSGHGTHVSGIIGAQRNNGNNANGIADNVEIMTVRVVPQGDEYDKDIACGIRYAVDNGAKIINMSFGKGVSAHKEWVDDAFKYAESKGVLLVHAAGNDSKNSDSIPSYPTKNLIKGGALNNFINVGASASSGIATGFSNYGKTQVDIFAPGANILSTMPDNKYAESQGTSMAAPVVSGVAALVWSYYPELTMVQLKDILLKSVTVITKETSLPGNRRVKVTFDKLCITGGIVNAYNAVKMAEEMKTKKNSGKKAK